MLWSFIFKAFHIQWVLPQRVLDLLVGWRNWFGKHHSSIWNLVPLCLMWMIWRERNARVFDDQIRSPDLVLGTFVSSLFDWARIWGFTATATVTEFVASLHVVH
jgi:hypothetical protein